MTSNPDINEVMDTLRKWTDEKKNFPSPTLLVSTDDGSFHVCFYAGMGSSDSTSIDNYHPLYRATIEKLTQEGQLEVIGRTFTIYPGSDRFRKMIFKKQYAESE
ncbi:hypothetical protein [Marisediminitalea sp.]|uniref:hypothetical protein n=1 Tax=Marisediminitalea sp. TaxID=2662268 RepID=UPI0035127D2E